MIETILVILIVAVTIGWAVRSVYRAITQNQGGCNCSEASCPSKSNCQHKMVDFAKEKTFKMIKNKI